MEPMTLVEHIMTKKVITIKPDCQLKEAAAIFNQHHLRHLPVVKNKEIRGILSKTDLLRMCFAGQFGEKENDLDEVILGTLTLEDVMVKNVITVKPGNTVEEAAEMLLSREFHALPVVDQGKIEGIITTTDIIRHFLEQSRNRKNS